MSSTSQLRQAHARSRATAIVAGAALVSGAAYVAFSQELRFELRDGSYKNALIGAFFRERRFTEVQWLRPVNASGLLMLAVFIAVAAVAAFAIRRAYGQSHGRLELCVFGVAAMTVPALLIATLLWPDGSGYLGSLQLLSGTAVVAVVAVVFARRATIAAVDLRPIAGTRDPGQRWAPIFLALLVPLVIALWCNAIGDIRGFDSLADHLPRAARWLRLGRLSEESGQLLTPYYPGDFQLMLRWMLTLGTDAYAFVPALLAGVLAPAAIYGICRELDQPRWTATVSTAAAASCSLIPHLATTAQADTATAAWLLLAVFFLLRWLRSVRPSDVGDDVSPSYNAAALGALGLSLGLAVGTKYSAAPCALVIILALAWYARRASESTLPDGGYVVNARTFVMLLTGAAIPAVLAAGYWFVRNTILHHNPLYPVQIAGLPGVPLASISIVKPTLLDSYWKRLTYPWVQWEYGYQFDDGVGAAFPAVAIVSYLALLPRLAPRSRRRMLWLITAASYLFWINTGSIMARFGLFPILLTYVFIGEAWREFESVLLKLTTFASYALSVGVATYSLFFGAVYTASLPGHGRGVPTVVDSLPAARILNATSANNRYALLGTDYRHEVITMFRTATPADIAETRARYVLLSAKQIPVFTAVDRLQLVGTGPALWGDTLSLWKVQ